LLDQGVADQADVGAVLGLRRREIAAAFDSARVDVGHARGLAGEIHVGHFFVAKPHADGAADAGANLGACGAAISDGLHVVELNLPVLQSLDDDVEVSDGEGSAGDLKDVGAQVGDFLLNIDVRALNQGHDRDQRGHAHGQPQHSERGTQFVGAQGVETFGQIVADGEHRRGEAFVGRLFTILTAFFPRARPSLLVNCLNH